jgi:hypothetical protein
MSQHLAEAVGWMRKSEDILINLYVTRRCNFACSHCLSESSPSKPRMPMSEEDAMAIRDFANLFEGRVTFNFVGGEPTLYLPALERLHRILSEAEVDHSFEMTTNGWWLFKPTAAAKVGRWIFENSIYTRISHSPHHAAHRKPFEVALLERFSQSMSAFADWLRREVYEDLMPFVGDSDDEESLEAHDELACRQLKCYSEHLYLMVEDRMLFVDRQHDVGISNTGRAVATQVYSTGGMCHAATASGGYRLEFTFNPGATIADFCCHGGKTKGGHASEGLALLVRRQMLMEALDSQYGRAEYRRFSTVNMLRCEGCEALSRKTMARKRTVTNTLKLL